MLTFTKTETMAQALPHWALLCASRREEGEVIDPAHHNRVILHISRYGDITEPPPPALRIGLADALADAVISGTGRRQTNAARFVGRFLDTADIDHALRVKDAA